MSNNSQEQFDINILDKITTGSNNNNNLENKGFFYYFKMAGQSDESSKLRNFLIALLLISIYLFFTGFQVSDFERISIASYAVLNLCAYWFSLYSLLKAKHHKNKKFTYGYNRYETLAAFSNCIFIIIGSLSLVLGSLHFHIEEHDHSQPTDEQQNDQQSNDQQENQDQEEENHNHYASNIYIIYGMLIYNIIGVFAFAEYALFAPLEDISKDINFSGVSTENYSSFQRGYKKLNQLLFENKQVSKTHSKEFLPLHDEEKNDHLEYSSHFENMHSMFLQFLTAFIFNLGKVFAAHLNFIPQIGILIALLTFFIVIQISKKLLIVTSRLLLQALPVKDTKNIVNFLKQVEQIEGVVEIKERYFWAVSTGYIICNLNIIVTKNANQEQIQQQINEFVNNKFQEISVQMETEF